jgi:hypothetical protein
MPKAWLMVRAVVTEPSDRCSFDDWYRVEHLPDAVKAFSVQAAWRGWSQTEPSVHCACYQFESLDRLRTTMEGPEIEALIAEFDRVWNGRVVRTREVISVADEMGGG